MDWAFSTETPSPCIVGFMILLPDPVPLPPKSTWFAPTDEPAPELSRMLHVPVAGVEPIEMHDDGRNFVSLRFWQMIDDSTPRFAAESELLHSAFEAMHPRDGGEPDGPSLSEEVEEQLADDRRYRTVVEAVTFNSAESSTLTPIDRCLNALLKFHRAYRVTAPRPLAELTVKRLFPMTFAFTRQMDEEAVTPIGLLILDGTWPGMTGNVTEIDHHMFDQVAEMQRRLDRFDPLARFMESRTDADYALHGVGSYRDAIIHLGIACEVLFDSLLGMLMWEEDRSVEEGAEVFSIPIARRIKTQFHPRLKGTWKVDAGEVGEWSTHVADVRNRVVHAGYLPTRQEAIVAESAADGLRLFISNKLAAAGARYPYTGLTLFSEARMPEGVPTLNKAARTWVAANRERLADLEDDHRVWREAVNAEVLRRGRS